MNNEKIKKKLEQLLAERDGAHLPVWIRAPRAGEYEHFSGLSRGKLYQLESLGLIKTASLRPPGAVRGVRLFHLGSLLKYIECLSAECTAKQSDSLNG
jgi:hypothetical protein